MNAPSLNEQAQMVLRMANRALIQKLVPRPRQTEEDRIVDALLSAADTLRKLANEGAKS